MIGDVQISYHARSYHALYGGGAVPTSAERTATELMGTRRRWHSFFKMKISVARASLGLGINLRL